MKLDHKGLAVKTSMKLGYRPALEYLLGSKEQEIKIKKAEDSIPHLCQTPWLMGKPYYLDMSAGCFVLLISPPGSGKTWYIRGLIGEMIDCGYLAVDLTSIKNNFYWSMFPLQKKYWRFLPGWRQPHSLPVVPFVPEYMKRRVSMLKGMISGSISIADVEPEDISYMCGFEENQIQNQIIKLAWGSGSKPKSIDGLIRRVSNINQSKLLREISDESKDTFQKSSIGAARRAIFFLKQEKIFSDTDTMNFVDILENPTKVENSYYNGGFPILCFGGQREPKEYHSTYITNIIRQIYRKKTKKSSKLFNRRIVFIFDDMGTLACPSKYNPPSKDVIINDLISLGREYGIYVIGSVQNLTQIPEEIIRQVKYFIFFKNIDGNDLDLIAKSRRQTPSAMRSSLRNVKLDTWPPGDPKGIRSCLVLKNDNSAQFGWVPAPCSGHSDMV